VVVPPPAPPPPAISEVTLLEQARVALRGGNAARALELADQHAAVYPDGALAEEREALAIEALAKLGRHDEAAAKWTKFASSYPHSNYRARLQRLIEIPR
jgi:tetratricopeptide (TPR) repeat protein